MTDTDAGTVRTDDESAAQAGTLEAADPQPSEDTSAEAYAACCYLRGLIAKDGRPHEVIAAQMGVSPAEFTQRFSFNRENIPPWPSIAPVFAVLKRDPAPFLDGWGQFWSAPLP